MAVADRNSGQEIVKNGGHALQCLAVGLDLAVLRGDLAARVEPGAVFDGNFLDRDQDVAEGVGWKPGRIPETCQLAFRIQLRRVKKVGAVLS